MANYVTALERQVIVNIIAEKEKKIKELERKAFQVSADGETNTFIAGQREHKPLPYGTQVRFCTEVECRNFVTVSASENGIKVEAYSHRKKKMLVESKSDNVFLIKFS